jgi:hypothetical protein
VEPPAVQKKGSLLRTLTKWAILAELGFGVVLVATYESPAFQKQVVTAVPELKPYIDESYPYYTSLRKTVVDAYQQAAAAFRDATASKDLKEEQKKADAPAKPVSIPLKSEKAADKVLPETPKPAAPVFPVIPFKTFDDVMKYLHGVTGRLAVLAAGLPQDAKQRKEIQAIVDHIDKELAMVVKWQEMHSAEARHHTASALKEQAAEFASKIEKRVEEVNQSLVKTMTDKFAGEKEELAKKHAAEMDAKLKDQEQKLQKAFEDKFKAEVQQVERRYNQKVQWMVDKERAGRLARLDHLALRVKKLEQLTTSFSERLHISERTHKQIAALHSLLAVLEQEKQKAFTDPLDTLKQASQTDPFVTQLLRHLPEDVERRGIVPLSTLKSEFHRLEHRIRDVELVPEDGGLESHIVSFIFSKLLFRQHALSNGKDVESVLARTEHHLNSDDLDAAARELNQLAGWSKKIVQEWLKQAREHLETKQALTAVYSHLAVQSLALSQGSKQ